MGEELDYTTYTLYTILHGHGIGYRVFLLLSLWVWEALWRLLLLMMG